MIKRIFEDSISDIIVSEDGLSAEVTTGENKIDVNLDSLNGGTTVKAILWNDFEPMTDAAVK